MKTRTKIIRAIRVIAITTLFLPPVPALAQIEYGDAAGGGGGSGPTTNPVSATEGGTGDNTSAVTGVPFINAGDWTYGNIPEANVTNLVTDLGAKAADSAVVHNTGTETVAGAKTFSTVPVLGTLAGILKGTAGAISAGVATIADLASSTSANLASVLSDETGSNKAVFSDSPTIAAPLTTGRATFGSAVDAANAVDIDEVAGQITFEGATADTVETRIVVADPTVGDQAWTIPNAGAVSSRTFVSLEAGQTFTGNNTYSGTSTFGQTDRLAADLGFYFGAGTTDATNSVSTRTAGTPDAAYLLAGSLGNSWHLAESADKAFDFNNGPCGTSACTDPTFITHSHNQTTNEWVSQTHDGTNAVIASGKGGLSLPAHKAGVGTAPAVSACGTTPSTVTGSDGRGRLTTGSGGTVQSCTLTFAVAYAVAPSCVANDETSILAVRAVATTTTLVIDSAVAGTLASQVVNYVCEGL